MADLPIVVLGQIFDFLSIREKLRLRSTCKTWKFVIEAFDSPQSLTIYSAKFPYNERWCFSNRIVTEDEILFLKFNRDPSRRFSLRVEFFRNLQSLYLYDVDYLNELDLFLEEVQELSRLKVLMIKGRRIHLERLSLPSLEKLSLGCSHLQIDLDAPNLSSLACLKDSPLNNEVTIFRFPLKVKHLECRNFTSNLAQLKNLETLLCRQITTNFSLENFKSLKRLEIWPTVEQLPQVMRIQEERKLLNRNDMKLIVSGFEEELASSAGNKFIPSYLMLTPAYLERLEKNCSKFVKNPHFPWPYGIEFETLVKYADGVLNKLFDGCHFRVGAIQHSSVLALQENGISLPRLIEILKKSHTPILLVGKLSPSYSSNRVDLPVEFYHKISCLESLIYLQIEIRFENFDFDCLLKLKNLQILRIHSEMRPPISFICKMLKQFKFFIEFSYDLLNNTKGFRISISFLINPQDLDHPFYLCYGSQSRVSKHFKDADEVIEELNTIN